jgi:hypothetical protein
MSAVLSELTSIGSSILSNVLKPVPQGLIGTIPVQATFEETGTDLVTITDHPVEAGAQISDHAYYRPAELMMRCGWSNSSAANLVGAVSSLFSSGGVSQFAGLSQLSSLFGGSSAPPTSGGGMSVSDYVSGIYTQLLSLQQSLQPFSVTTSIRQYTNMMFASLVLTRDQKTSQALMVAATFRQVIIVNTVTTTLAPIANLASPANNAETVALGPQSAVPNAAPAPGGAVSPNAWPEGSDEAAGIFEPGEEPPT